MLISLAPYYPSFQASRIEFTKPRKHIIAKSQIIPGLALPPKALSRKIPIYMPKQTQNSPIDPHNTFSILSFFERMLLISLAP